MRSRDVLILGTAGVSILAVVLLLTGVPALPTLMLVLFVLWQAVAGVIVWRWLRPKAPLLEVAGAALAVGTALAALSGLATATAGLGPWGWAVPSAAAAAVWLARHRRRVVDERGLGDPLDAPAVWGLAAAVVPGLAILAYALRSYPLTWDGSWTAYHPDMPFFEALSTSLARFGAFESPFMSDGLVRYHWLSYAWAGQLTVAADAVPFVTITRVLPVVALLGSAAMVVSWTRQLSPRSWTPVLAGLLLSLGGFTGAVFGGVLTMDSPSQSMSVLWLIAFCMAVIHVTTSQVRLLPAALLVGVLSLSLIGGKVSAAAPAVAGVLLMTAVQWVRRDVPRRRSVWVLVATLLGAMAGFAAFLSGSLGGGGLTIGSLVNKASSQQGLNPIDTKYAVVAGTAILLLAVVPRWAGILWLLTRREWRWRPEVMLSVGLAGSSLAALVAFNSFNEVWFSSTVSGPLAAITAVGAGSALDHLSPRARPTARAILTVAGVLAAAMFATVWVLWATGASGGNVWVPTLRWLGPIAAWLLALVLGAFLGAWGRGRLSLSGLAAGAALLLVLVSVPGRLLGAGTGLIAIQENGLRNEWFSLGSSDYAPGPDMTPLDDWTSTRMDAARWLWDNSAPTDLLATNITFGPFVAGVSHLPTYVSARWYQTPYGPPWMSPELLTREERAWAFIDTPSTQTLSPLCDAGVRWLWIDVGRTEQRDWEPFARTVVQNDDTIIAEVDPSACAQT